jgi:hypothetical protein
MKEAIFKAKLAFIDNLAEAGIPDEYKNPLLTWIKLIFADDQPNANKQGIKQEEFPNLIKSMAYMPIKANYNSEGDTVEGHFDAAQIGVLKEGQQEANKIVAVGALYNDESPNIVEFFKKEMADGNAVNFSWEIRYKDSSIENDTEWLSGTTTKAITAVKLPAYEGRTPLVSISSFDFVKAIDDELRRRELLGVKK